MHGRLIALPLLVGSLFFTANTAFCAEPTPRFCEVSNDELQIRDGQALWGPASVQHYIREVLQKPYLKDTPNAAYPLTYLHMTAERDRERCGGTLSADDEGSEVIGDLLADIMSRWLVLSVDICSQTRSDDLEIGICGAIHRGAQGRYDSLRSAVELTSAYLSSHMASALAAVILSDHIWLDNFPSPTHCPVGRDCPTYVLENRLRYVQDYKSLYDKNNAFLAGSIATVTQTLSNACYIRGPLVPAGGQLVNKLSIIKLIFSHLRDQTFKAGIALARSIRPELHPMLRRGRDGYVEVEYGAFGQFQSLPQGLVELEKGARAAFANDAWSWLLKPLGGRDASELLEIRPSANPSCSYPTSTEEI
jgi:hypothetical protein